MRRQLRGAAALLGEPGVVRRAAGEVLAAVQRAGSQA
jgi:hypothetical protein